MNLRTFSYKKIGYLDLDNDTIDATYADFIKVIYLKAGGEITVDFTTHSLPQDALLFINRGQHYKLEPSTGTLLYYNRDFYCVEIHDKEVACDGILFRNVYEIPVVYLNEEAAQTTRQIIHEIKKEIDNNDTGAEEMIRVLLKQLIIRSTRLWQKEHGNAAAAEEVDFLRKFSQLVDNYYATYHNVSDYATLLSITPKALSKRIAKHSKTSPNDLIKDRIILEAKRLLVHTDLSVKEIGYKLGYEDPAYFVRVFTNQNDLSPLLFRKQYGEKVQ